MSALLNSYNINNKPQAKPNVGILTAPDYLPKAQVYSDIEARQNFKVLSSDVYHLKNTLTRKEKTKTLSGIFVAGAVLFAVVVGVKTGVFLKFKALLKPLFNRLKAH